MVRREGHCPFEERRANSAFVVNRVPFGTQNDDAPFEYRYDVIRNADVTRKRTLYSLIFVITRALTVYTALTVPPLALLAHLFEYIAHLFEYMAPLHEYKGIQ